MDPCEFFFQDLGENTCSLQPALKILHLAFKETFKYHDASGGRGLAQTVIWGRAIQPKLHITFTVAAKGSFTVTPCALFFVDIINTSVLSVEHPSSEKWSMECDLSLRGSIRKEMFINYVAL